MKKIILTGDRPTGKLHLGHYVGSLKRRVSLQDNLKDSIMMVMIADAQALTDNFNAVQKVRDNILEVAFDYLACGIDPDKVIIFIQSQIPELAELTFYLSNLVTVSRLERNPTVKAEIRLKNFETSIPVGFLTYPISQAADILAFKSTIIPVGEDQLPMIEQAREIVRSFNNLYGITFEEPKELLPDKKECCRLPGTDGKNKMSKSLGNCIYLSDSPDIIRKKVMGMYTDPKHVNINDPGNVEDNPVFIYLRALCTEKHFKEYLPEYNSLQELETHYSRGGVGDVKVKKFLNEIIQAELYPIRTRREKLERNRDEVMNILLQGTLSARKIAQKNMQEIRTKIGINYFGEL